MLQTKFLSAGSSTEEALVYVCELASSIFLEEDDYPGAVSYTHLRAHET